MAKGGKNPFKVLYRHKYSGTALTEYVLQGTCLIVLAMGALGILSQAIYHLLTSPSRIKSETNTLSLLSEIKNSSGQISANQGQVTFTTVNGNVIKVSTVLPDKLGASILTAGANGTTHLLADTLTSLANQLKADQEISDSQYNSLVTLANEGHNLAEIEARFEKLVRKSPDVAALSDKFDGSPLTFNDNGEAAFIIGYATPIENGFTVSNVFDEEEAAPATLQFLKAYDNAAVSGALSDPKVKVVIDSLVGNIGYLSHVVGATVGKITSSDIAASQMTATMASAATHYDSIEICTTGNASDSGIHCSAVK